MNMSAILNKFLLYLKRIEGCFENADFDLTDLIEELKYHSPIPLKLSDPETALRNMSSVIIQNLCNYSTTGTFPKYGLEAIKCIVTKNLDNEDDKAQQILFVHITKMTLSAHQSALYFKYFEQMKIKTEYSDQENAWKQFSLKVLAHSDINNRINDVMIRTFGSHYTQRTEETNSIKVSVKFVHTTESELRGFVGINCLYINVGHFSIKMFLLNMDTRLSDTDRQNILLMDIATVTIHEYSHIRIRQVLDNLNMSSPNFIPETTVSADVEDPEFGRIVERNFFNATPDWRQSIACGGVPLQYISNFLDAVNSNTALPALPENVIVINRSGPIALHGGGGADLAYEDRYIE